MMNDGFEIRTMSENDFLNLFNVHKTKVFEHDHSYNVHDALSTLEQEQIKALKGNDDDVYKLYLGVFNKKKEFVGWSWGYQENPTTFYMVNSAILEEYRNKGLYSGLVCKCIEILKEKGFQLVYSRHCATNNAVLIPKLKQGFIISKMEIDDRFGVLIHLHYYTNDLRRKVMDYRSGQKKPDQDIKELFDL